MMHSLAVENTIFPWKKSPWFWDVKYRGEEMGA